MNRRLSTSWRSPRSEEPGDDLLLAFSRELARARRVGKSVSALVAPAGDGVDDEQLQTLRLYLRRYDLVGVVDGAVVVLAPEVERSGAEVLRARLEASGVIGWTSRLGLAVAPEDGDSLDAVVRVALQFAHDPEGATS